MSRASESPPAFAELTSEDDATSFFERADDALYRAKGAGKARAFPAAAREPRAPETGRASGR